MENQTIAINFLYVSSNLQYFYDTLYFETLPSTTTTANPIPKIPFQQLSDCRISASDSDLLLGILLQPENLDIHLKGLVYRLLTPSYYFALRQKFSILKKLYLLQKIQESDYQTLFTAFQTIHNYLQTTYSKDFIISEYEIFLKTYSKENTYTFASYCPTIDLLNRPGRVT